MADRDKGRTLWREEVIQEANRVQSDLDRSEFVPDAKGRRYVEDRLHQARDAAEAYERRWKRVRSWWSGVDIEAAWRAIHAAKQELIDGMADPDLRAQYPLLRSKVKQYLEPNDPERVEYEKWLERGEEQESLDQFDRARLRTVRTAVDATSDAQYAKIHRFRTTLYIGFVAVIVLDILLGLERSTDPWLPICPPTPMGGASCPLVWQIEAVGLIGGVLAAAVALLRIPVTHEPYNLKRAQTLVKLPLSALTALVGIMLLQSNVIDALEPLPAPGVLAYAVIFGYSQELVTRLIDRKAESLVSPEVEVAASA